MKIIFFGTPEFSVPSLVSIINSKHELLTVVTNPDKRVGRGLKKRRSPIKDFCIQHSIDCISFDSFDNQETLDCLGRMNADLFVVVAFKILPEKIINIPKHASINLHPSMLPKYRGSSPIQYAILNGDTKTGITIFRLNKNVDSGDIIIQKEYSINNEIVYTDLYNQLSEEGASLLLISIKLIAEGKVKYIYQNKGNISHAFKIKSNDCKIIWNNSAYKIHNKIRAFSSKPGAFTFLNGKKVKIFNTSIDYNSSKELDPGAGIISDDYLSIGTKDYPIIVRNIQIEGKKMITARDFSNSIFSINKTIHFE